jgi:hypothetical protein
MRTAFAVFAIAIEIAHVRVGAADGNVCAPTRLSLGISTG